MSDNTLSQYRAIQLNWLVLQSSAIQQYAIQQYAIQQYAIQQYAYTTIFNTTIINTKICNTAICNTTICNTIQQWFFIFLLSVGRSQRKRRSSPEQTKIMHPRSACRIARKNTQKSTVLASLWTTPPCWSRLGLCVVSLRYAAKMLFYVLCKPGYLSPVTGTLLCWRRGSCWCWRDKISNETWFDQQLVSIIHHTAERLIDVKGVLFWFSIKRI